MSDRLELFATAWVHGEIVEEAVVGPGHTLLIGPGGQIALPAPEGAPYVLEATWSGLAEVVVADGRSRLHRMGADDALDLQLGPVRILLQLVPRFTLRRTRPIAWEGSLAWGLVVLATTLLTLQVDVVMRNRCAWFGIDCGGGDPSSGIEVNAEYIARLLDKDFAGEENVENRPVEVPEHPVVHTRREFLPAGQADGADPTPGGADLVEPVPVRAPPGEEVSAAPAEKVEPVEAIELAPVGAVVEVEGQEPTEVDPSSGEDLPEDEVVDPEAPEQEAAADDQEGWGLHDWMDASPEEREVRLMIEVARRRLAIDPNDTDALSLLAYYQYLGEDLDGAMATYDKLIALEPEDAAAYNNKALILKRRKDWPREEMLYRTALALDPEDTTALNNLAVNLAHQARFDEALAIMKRLEVELPDDAYSDLHRAKIAAQMGDDAGALAYLDRALGRMASLDLLHHIEFRQDIRLDPSFERLRDDGRFRAILRKYYGKEAPI